MSELDEEKKMRLSLQVNTPVTPCGRVPNHTPSSLYKGPPQATVGVSQTTRVLSHFALSCLRWRWSVLRSTCTNKTWMRHVLKTFPWQLVKWNPLPGWTGRAFKRRRQRCFEKNRSSSPVSAWILSWKTFPLSHLSALPSTLFTPLGSALSLSSYCMCLFYSFFFYTLWLKNACRPLTIYGRSILFLLILC